jgi:phosphoserine phosphatase
MTKVLLIRHGHVDGIMPERFRGRINLALTERGQAEAAAVARRIGAAWRPEIIYTSPLDRCVATGAAISKACGAGTRVLEALNDIDYGDWQFRSYDEAQKADPDLYAKWFRTPQLVRFPNGESLQDLAARVADVLRHVLSHHPDDVVVLVGHDSVNRAILLQLLDQPLSSYWRLAQSPCSVNEIDIVGDRICILRINETLHLDPIKG